MTFWAKLKKVFSAPEKITQKTRQWIDREGRVRFSGMEGVTFTEKATSPNKKYSVINVSTTGIALFSDANPPPIGSRIVGTLKIGDHAIELNLEVIRVESGMIGAKMVEKSAELNRELNEVFNLEVAASSMTKMRSELLAPTEDGTPHCITGKNDCRLYFIEKDGVLQQFDVCFFGYIVEGFKDQKLRFGSLYSDRSMNDIRKRKTILLSNHDSTEEMKADAIRFVSHIELIDPSIKGSVIRAIQDGKL